MAEEHVTLVEAIEIARRLSSSEQLKLRQELDQMITSDEKDFGAEHTEADFRKRLLESGLVSKIRLGEKQTEPEHKYVPVPVKGKPVSQTIIEDRR
jgi:hypothetical protein